MYDPSLEWPGESSKAPRARHPLRLLVLKSSILPSKHRKIILLEEDVVQLGRDISSDNQPRIRLKEMQVSKLHASVFWDTSSEQWSVVDHGSVHGTHVKPPSHKGPPIRLSQPRIASIPRLLRDLDVLSVGSTQFLVHLHPDNVQCEECTAREGQNISLLSTNRKAPEERPSLKRLREAAGVQSVEEAPPRDAKKALTMLKKSMMNRHESTPAEPKPQYIDRSARRRAQFPTHTDDAPGVTRTESPVMTPLPPTPSASYRIYTPPPAPVVEPPKPLPTSNLGHRLLLKQGWEPGTALGVASDLSGDRVGLINPIETNVLTHRAGLGMLASDMPPQEYLSRKERRQQRWNSVQGISARAPV